MFRKDFAIFADIATLKGKKVLYYSELNYFVMFNENDIKLIEKKGIKLSTIEEQLSRFKNGFPYLKVVSAASIGNGIIKLNKTEETECIYTWEEFLLRGGSVEKFVPASGAASRMFKNMFAFLNADYDVPTTQFEKDYFAGIHNFAFFNALNNACTKHCGKDINTLLAEGNYKEVVKMMLTADGLNYGNLPKGVLQFHKCCGEIHTAIEEHLEEGAQYASDKDKMVDIHFTVSPEHRELFKKVIEACGPKLEAKYGIKYNITMSEQKSSTDPIAVNKDNTPFRNSDGSLLFRPAGHGALIENLNERNADVVFIKNIDNVVPMSKRDITIRFKQIIGGYLILLQKAIAKYLTLIDSGNYTIEDLREIIHFVHDKLSIRYPETKFLDDSELAIYLRDKLNRPIRVCGVVKNDGEPGGGPFIAFNSDGSYSPQILESSQFSDESKGLMAEATHFNPVDLVCYIKDMNGEKFNLPAYVDHNTGFISEKSKDGKELRALELPGLWNGSMSDWNTVFIEVPAETFNPVKTVNDLLRPMHQQ